LHRSTIDARQHLSSLIGKTIHTLTYGDPNKVLGFEGSNVLVETKRSKRQPVPLEEIQTALDRLVAGETVTVNPKSIGYRSSFIGAVMAQVPGAVVVGDRPRAVKLP
jgi:hypothetical protein